MSTKDLAKIIIPIGIAVIVIVIIIVAIYFPPTGTLECSLQSAPGDPHADYTYRIKFNFWKVKQMEAEEIIYSEKEDVLKRFEESEREISKEFELSDYYHREISLKGKKLISKTTIDYTKMDFSNIISKEEQTELQKGNLKIGTMKKIYKDLGAKCSYK